MFYIVPKFNRFIKILLLVILSSLYSPITYSDEKALIAFSVTDCEKAYLIQIFKNGKITYWGGYGVKVIGKRKAYMSKQTLKALLKKFDDAHFITTDNRVTPPVTRSGNSWGAIRLYQKNQTAIFFNPHLSPDSSILILQTEIIRVTKAKRWVTDTNVTNYCDEVPLFKINIKNSKLININSF
jgi:hypothetical protein